MKGAELATALLQLTAGAGFYDLADPAERALSRDHVQELFLDLQATLRPENFVEAGAFNARTSLRMRDILPDARITAFEANPYNHAAFSAEADFAAAGVDYRLAALTDAEGPVTFRILRERGPQPEGDAALISWRSSILSRTEGWARYVDVEVPGTRLDAAFAGVAGDFALWIDVEGAVRQVLRGAEGLLPRVASLMIEVETRRFWQDQWLYVDVCAHLLGQGLLPVARDFEDENQFNIVFVNAATFARPETLPVLERHHSARLGRWPARLAALAPRG